MWREVALPRRPTCPARSFFTSVSRRNLPETGDNDMIDREVLKATQTSAKVLPRYVRKN